MTGDERKEFMKACLSGDDAAAQTKLDGAAGKDEGLQHEGRPA